MAPFWILAAKMDPRSGSLILGVGVSAPLLSSSLSVGRAAPIRGRNVEPAGSLLLAAPVASASAGGGD